MQKKEKGVEKAHLLAPRSNDKLLGPATDEEIALLVDVTQVSRFHPPASIVAM